MYLSSDSESDGCSSGRRYNKSQAMSQRKPIAPVAMKAARQPHLEVIQKTTGGVTIAPMLVPELKIPVASARSFFGNHSATVLIAAGKLPASPRPKAIRAAPKPTADRAKEWAIAARLQNTIAIENPFRVPRRSIKPPTTKRPIAYDA